MGEGLSPLVLHEWSISLNGVTRLGVAVMFLLGIGITSKCALFGALFTISITINWSRVQMLSYILCFCGKIPHFVI